MVHFDDLTEAELAVRALLTRAPSDFMRRDTPFARWAQEIREAWARTPAGLRAIAECDAKRAQAQRRRRGGR